MTFLTLRTFVTRAVCASCIAASMFAGNAAQAKGGSPASSTSQVAGEILVQLLSTAALQPLLVKYQLTVADQFGARPIYRLRVIGAASVADKVTALTLEPTVIVAEPNFIHGSPEASKNGAWAIGEPSAYQAQWAPAAMHLPAAQLLTTGVGITVAVLDTGIDATHPALAGRLVPGFDFVDFDNDPSEVGNHATNISFGHGTHVAGLVALAAPGAKIMPLRVLDVNGQGNAWVLAQAILYAVDPDSNPATNDGASVINLSLATTQRTHLMDTISLLVSCTTQDPAVAGAEPPIDISDPGYNGDKDRCAHQGGAVVVAAAGNDGTDALREYPAAEHAYGLISVGASDSTGHIATFSNFGWVDMTGPGDGITSTVPGGGFGVWSGTSMAAPLVSGTVALVQSLNRGMTSDDVVQRVIRISGTACGKQPMPMVDTLAALRNISPVKLNCH
jgi:subtilisin family serine protease